MAENQSKVEMLPGDPEAPPISLDQREIQALLPHRHPFVMVDRVEDLVPGHRAVGIRAVSASEPWFQGHFPGDPILPGVLLAESFAQVAALVALAANRHLVGRPVYLLSLDKLRFRRPVRPGDLVRIRCQRDWIRRGLWHFEIEATVDGDLAARGEVTATVG